MLTKLILNILQWHYATMHFGRWPLKGNVTYLSVDLDLDVGSGVLGVQQAQGCWLINAS